MSVEAHTVNEVQKVVNKCHEFLLEISDVIENSDEWWIDCYSCGGIDGDKLEELLEELKRLTE